MAITPRLISLATEEGTPFLPEDQGESSNHQDSAGHDDTLPSPDLENVETSASMARIFSVIKITTYCSLTSSVVCLVLLLAAFFTTILSPYSRYSWEADYVMGIIAKLGICVFFSAILSILNLGTLLHANRHPPRTTNLMYLTPRTTFFWLPFTFLVDALFAVTICYLAAALSGWASFPNYCREDDQHQDPATCERWRLSLQILCAAGIGMSVIVGLSHLILLISRGITAFHSGLLFRPAPWNLPVKGVTVQFTLKLLGTETCHDSENSN